MAAQADGWTSALRGGVGRQSRSAMAQNHVDVDALLEDYAWKHFKDIQSLRKTRLDDFKNLEREDVEFVLDRFASKTFGTIVDSLLSYRLSVFAIAFHRHNFAIFTPIGHVLNLTINLYSGILKNLQSSLKNAHFEQLRTD
uniref:Centrosomal protein of 44 kDa n=1 Tax=Ascaris lumbricoides TaxID=6252 RepID=A0A0M3HVQ7_ASCLU